MAGEAWLEENRLAWDARVPVHLASGFYDVDGFLAGRSSLRPYEPALLGELAGRSLVHLQCHFGLDTLSWARLGAEVTGLDLAPSAVLEARRLAEQAGLAATFVEGNVYDAPELLGRRFDVVYTGLGAICWIPDLNRWAKVVADLLEPGGTLCLVEFHPLLSTLADEGRSFAYDYFSREPVREPWADSYANAEARFEPLVVNEWVQPLSLVLCALIGQGFRIEHLAEYPSACFKAWADMVPAADGPGRWTTPPGEPRIPLEYSLVATLG